MIIQRVEQADWLSNSYLVVDEPGGKGVLIDGNGVIEPLLERADREETDLTHYNVILNWTQQLKGGFPSRRP